MLNVAQLALSLAGALGSTKVRLSIVVQIFIKIYPLVHKLLWEQEQDFRAD
jgi:hypothetical protein